MRRGGGSSTTYGHPGTKIGGSKKKAKSRSTSRSKSRRALSASPIPKAKAKSKSRERERSRKPSRSPSPSVRKSPSPRRGRDTTPVGRWKKSRSRSASQPRVRPSLSIDRYAKEGRKSGTTRAALKRSYYGEDETPEQKRARFARGRPSAQRPPLAPRTQQPPARASPAFEQFQKRFTRSPTPEDVPMDLPTPTRQKVAPVLKPYKEQFSDWRSAPEQKTDEAEAQIAREQSEMMAKYGSKRTPSPAAPPPQPSPARQKPESVPIAAQPVQAMAPARRLGGGPRKTRLTSSVPREAAAPKVIGYQGGKGVTQMPHKAWADVHAT